MSMRCKQCAESFPKNQPYDLFELRRHKFLPADPDDGEVRRHMSLFCKVIEGWKELPLGQVASGAEDHHYAGLCGPGCFVHIDV